MLDISKIRRDGGTQSRAKIDEVTVAEYADAMAYENNVFRPVEVYYDGKDYWLADGFHRIEAWKRIGRSEIPANVHRGDRRRAILHSVQANTTHGLRRSNEDKRHSVKMLLEDPEWSQWPQGKIAKACVVSREFVNRVSQEMAASCDRSQDAARTVDRSGKSYRQNTTKIGKTKSTIGADTPAKLRNSAETAPTMNPVQQLESARSAEEDPRHSLAQLPREALEMEVIGLRRELAEAKDHIRSQFAEIKRLKARSKTIIRSLANERDQETREKVKAINELQRLQEINDGTEKRVKELEATRR